MKNSYSTYILLDGSTATILFHSVNLNHVMFLQRNVLDTRFFSIPTSKWTPELLKPASFYKFQLNNGERVLEKQENLHKVVIEKAARCRFLAEGYSWLFWFANQVTEQYSTTETLDYEDLALYNANKEIYIKTFANARQLTIEQAQKQFDFDHETLITVSLRRKQILWTLGESLKLCVTPTELALWKDNVFDTVVKIGAV